MSTKAAPSIFSRILMVIASLAVIGLAYWFIRTSLAPVPAPPPAAGRGSVRFDPALDVSKNETFFRLRPLAPSEVLTPQPGRLNPFVPVPPPAPPPTTTTSTVTPASEATAPTSSEPTSTGFSY